MSESNSLFDLTGRTPLVTGSSQGLGLAFARGLVQAGAAAVLNGRDENKMRSASEILSNEGARVSVSSFNVTSGAAVKKIESSFAPIDILINNTGIQNRVPLTEMTEAQWRGVIDTNLTGAFLVARAVAPLMIARCAGKIINICSITSEVARPTVGNYSAAKGGLKKLTRAMAVEWAKHGLQINGISPGYFLTELN